MTGARYTQAPRRPRWALLALVAALHVLALLGLVRAFAPDFAARVTERASALVTVDIENPPPPPPPPPSTPSPEPQSRQTEGAAAEAGKQATPKAVTAPEPRIVLPSPSPVPIVAATGLANSAGARDAGEGTGAGGSGEGTGSGRSGTGQGGTPVTRPVKIAGDINNAADYPVPPGGRQARLGQSVTISMTVTVDGRARDCRILEPSTDPVADRITCELAERRFRFEPARDAAGRPVPATYGWRQMWFRK